MLCGAKTHDIPALGLQQRNPARGHAWDETMPAFCRAVHFGMSGRFSAAVGPAPEVRPTTRLALVNEEHNLVAHLSAMTVKHGGLGESQMWSAAHKGHAVNSRPGLVKMTSFGLCHVQLPKRSLCPWPQDWHVATVLLSDLQHCCLRDDKEIQATIMPGGQTWGEIYRRGC